MVKVLRMDLSRHWKSYALVFIVLVFHINPSQTRHHGIRHKRQHGAHLYLPESFIIPDGDTGDNWGQWGSPSECSRTCGGGVSYQTRECHDEDTSRCSGGNKKYFSCNTQDCPEESIDFRQQQCTNFNDIPFEGVRYNWVPYTKAPNPCELNCMPRGERFYYRHKSKVIDGTRCNDESLDVCVDGKCQPVGCDMMLGSTAKEDKCRNCAGDGATCKTVSGVLDMNNLQVGYNDILLIPAGATNIQITEREPSNNYLAIRNLTGHYHLNGNWRIDFPRAMTFADSIWHYDRKPQGFSAPDHLSSLGPTNEPVYLVLLYQDRNVGINYEYSIPESSAKQSEPDTYSWTFTNYRECSAKCGGGFQTRDVYCNSRSTLEQVDDSLCDSADKPGDTQQCGQESCPPRWVEGQWEKCSTPCGEEGTQNREIYCERVEKNGNAAKVEDAVCLEQVGNKPATKQTCNIDVVCPEWFVGPFSPCNKLCGDGEKKRQVVCYRKNEGKIVILNDTDCITAKPNATESCILRPCEGVDWITSSWSGCKSCGQTKETRTAFCASKSGKIYNESFCANREVPELVRPCKSEACKFQWFTSQWSKCSADCGKGVQTRNVVCAQFDGEFVRRADDEASCEVDLKPEDSKDCDGGDECPGQWFTGPWSSCNKNCGGGEMTRKILCIAKEELVPVTQCDQETIEFATTACNAQECEDDQVIPLDSKVSLEKDSKDEEVEEDEEDEEDTWCGDDEGSASGDDDDDDSVTKVMPSSSETDVYEYGSSSTSESTLETDELMQSDSTAVDLDTTQSDSSTDIITTSEGSGEGSGDDSTTVFDEEKSTDISSSDLTGSTELPGTTDDSSASTELPGTTDDSSASTELPGTTDDSSASTDSSATSTDSSSSTDGSSDASETTTSGSSDSTTEGSSSSIDSSTTESSEGTTDQSSESSTDTTESSPTTEISTEESSIASTTDSTETTTDSASTTVSGESSTTDSESTELDSTTDSSSTSDSGLSTETESATETTTDSSTESTDVSSTDVSSTDSSTGSTLSESEGTTVSSETEQTDSTSSDITTESGSSSTDDGSSTTDESSTDSSASTDSTITGETEVTESTVTGIEETTIDIWSTTDSSTDDSSSTQYTLEAVVTKAPKKCKRKPKKPACLKAKFGCCPDNSTKATGPFDEGCPVPETCKETKHGCCPDGVSPAKGKNNEECPESLCSQSLFGCCPDEFTFAENQEQEGCPEIPTTVGGCAASKHGCCPDGISEATGPSNKGCEEADVTAPVSPSDDVTEEQPSATEEPKPKDCSVSEFGCCPDGLSESTGENFHGCDIIKDDCKDSFFGCCEDNKTSARGANKEGCGPCAGEPFGCCPDGNTPAHGPKLEGCCLETEFGCCTDNITPARGTQLEGCACEYAPYGCCPDNTTSATGYYNEGCGCQHSPHGCCPDQSTPAQGANHTGCACHTFQFGCCPDGINVPKGPHNHGCHCSQKEFKCCSDDVTPAQGPDFAGCTCATSKHGCCPDGVTESQGKDFIGCENVPESPQKACALAKEVGTCNNYTVKSFFDMDYGSCSKFWYGGCDGNKNNFDTIDDCKNICQEPEGKDTCNLPKVQGPCTGYYPMWHFDADRGHCTQFIYGGCLGNNNRFETKEECQARCAIDESLEPCKQPADQGPCNGSFERWNYDHESDTCRPFSFGGCKPNKNNFATEHTCNYNCKKPGVMRPSCSLAKETGDCSGKHARWSFDKTENKCMPFYFTGCKGNDNSFISFEECENNCPKKIEKDLCHLPAETGECQDYTPRWYFDTKESNCRQFYYGGCGGNGNNFMEKDDCLNRCENKTATEAPAPAPAPEATPAPAFEKSQCLLTPEVGTCENHESRYYYNRDEGTCEQFGGCAGHKNNFATYEECEQSCQDVQDTCTLRPVYGRCSENTTRWYYDNRADSCAEFEFSGCRGNTNNFYTQQECENRCKPAVEVDSRIQTEDVCAIGLDHGSQECVERIISYFYNIDTTDCEAFEYTGCGGNGNRFESSEQCQRQCGGFKGVDVCSQPKETGPCEQWETRFYYNTQTRRCDAFTYGGCEGTGNRFNSLVECESVCISHEEPASLDNKAICALPAQTGQCDIAQTYHKRWFYDDIRGTCISFIYSGCAGNQNNFRSFDSCEQFCKTSDESENLIDHTDSPNICQSAFDECDALHCPYGVAKRYDENQCERCHCEDPCQGYQCPDDSNCAIDIQPDVSEGTVFVPVCRQVNKPGECPQLGNNTRCDRECYTDADCREDNKCCTAGCGFVCVSPAGNITETTEPPKPYYPGAKAPALEEIPIEEIDVIAEEGGLATLRCFATGYPPPTISWKRGGIIINTNQGRYVLTSTGDLQIVQLHRTDSGTYVCIADNGIGDEVTREVVLDVADPKDTKTNAYIVGDSNSTLIATLNQPATIRCLVGGNPRPYITWWKGKVILGLRTQNSEVTKDNSLVFHKVQLSDLGVYTCQAYSGEGKPVTITATLKAVGPVHIYNEADRPYLEYLVTPPETPKDNKPTYPYRPSQFPPKVIPPPIVEQPEIIPVSAHLYSTTGSTTYAVGAEISLQCDVSGTPTPEVRWFKDDAPLQHGGRVQITAQRLSVLQATVEDAGHYKCEARNEYNVVGPTEYVSVEGVFVPTDCTDNPFFANCKLIVTGKYCTHKYYANFCCRSCTLAGQLGRFQSNLV